MKKLFTLSIAIFCAVAINAQITESGNGFMETFDYADGTVAGDVTYGERLSSEWPEGATVESGVLQWDLAAEGESWLGFGFDPALDVSGYEVLEFMYQTLQGSETCIYMADSEGGESEICPDNMVAGSSELLSYTLDLADAEGLNTSKVIEVGFLVWTPNAGTVYFDEIKLGDGTVGISKRTIQNAIHLYPNPAEGEFKINADIESLAIYNLTGQVVYSMENYDKGSSVDISEFKTGLYLINADSRIQKLMVK